ncbi:SDR family oxidoreductase [Pseudoteredinibacter isoporae]|uniref:2-keto-3-deoxy-L-fuconate dehydrogenase n=1 Tax=Pseudoteredinibacter isoporae TaxID=570281 RepID=A0A7X0MWC7_9GAMM|nr:SDR family oxidoreductase [Pseudoteredinibacter isoporae]MBB6522586.1 2-keto-3-deoxy-L-fuconate dehydrogenase [Pseudoteredinibacter isoporae]NHO88116.1 SDR family oxidoreductase [Pseudoteredinibacter isoporae]NIB23553.1 SDR family oxidoreductase [Pseudoteredinibacter isoporae]
MRLQNKTALITAAAAGIGRSTVALFLAEGAEVWAADINQQNLDQLKADFPRVKTVRLDVTDQNAINDFVANTGNIDVLFNCAGFVANGDLLNSCEKDWDFSFELNVKSMYRLCKALLPGMIERGSGNIINMASVAGVSTAVANRLIYSASKAAVVGLTKSIAADYVTQGIRCNAICPGTVDTPSLQDRLNAFENPQQARKDFENRQPIGRLAKPGEIASLALYLASDESSYTTGVAHVIDGGWSNI